MRKVPENIFPIDLDLLDEISDDMDARYVVDLADRVEAAQYDLDDFKEDDEEEQETCEVVLNLPVATVNVIDTIAEKQYVSWDSAFNSVLKSSPMFQESNF